MYNNSNTNNNNNSTGFGTNVVGTNGTSPTSTNLINQQQVQSNWIGNSLASN